MKKRLAAGALAAASAAAVFGLPATAASAAGTSCGYGVNGNYAFTRTPVSETVNAGTFVFTRGTLRKGGTACAGYRLTFYTKPANIRAFTALATGTTDNTGSLHVAFRPKITTRFFYNFSYAPGKSIQTGISEIIIRK